MQTFWLSSSWVLDAQLSYLTLETKPKMLIATRPEKRKIPTQKSALIGWYIRLEGEEPCAFSSLGWAPPAPVGKWTGPIG